MDKDNIGMYFIRKMDDVGRILIPREARKLYNIEDGDSMEIICDDEKIIIKKHRIEKYFQASAEKIIDGFYAATKTPIVLCNRNQILISKGKKEISCKELSQDFIEQIRRNDATIYSNTYLNEDKTVKIKYFRFIIHSDECIGAVVIPDTFRRRISPSDTASLDVCAAAIDAYVY